MRVFLFALASVLAVALTTLAQQGPEENECALFPEATADFIRCTRFRPVDDDLYIWTDNDVYLWGDKITLFIEYVAREKECFTAQNPVETELQYLRLKRNGAAVEPRVIGYPDLKKRDWLPDANEIPAWRLHGRRLVFVTKDTREILPLEDPVYMEAGDSFVRRIPNVLDMFVTKKTPEGRVLVHCAKPDPKSPNGYKEFWAPIEGSYKLQYSGSNIIEFYIFQ